MTESPLRFLLDQGLPRDAAEELREAGIECVHVGEVGMSESADADILAWARDRGLVVVTLDADFHAMLAVEKASSPSVIRVRLQGLDSTAMAGVVVGVIRVYRDELGQGCMVTVKSRKTTCRMLWARDV